MTSVLARVNVYELEGFIWSLYNKFMRWCKVINPRDIRYDNVHIITYNIKKGFGLLPNSVIQLPVSYRREGLIWNTNTYPDVLKHFDT